MSYLSQLDTPAALIDTARLQHNIQRMQARMQQLEVRFRPHVKTSKCEAVTRAQIEAGAQGITVSTLKEAEQFFALGIRDILYAVGISVGKLPTVASLRQRGCDLKIITDNLASAQTIVEYGQQHHEVFEVWIEIDTDGHRSGITPESPALLEVASALHNGGMKLGGVMTHAGASYELDTHAALVRIAEQERAGCARAAQRLREAGIPCANVSVGSTPTALSAEHLAEVTEVRAGVYVLFDLVMHNIGMCSKEEIALSVLATVIGHQEEKGWAIVDAGWMALSRDRGTQRQKHDYGYGQVCDIDGVVLGDYIVSGANQEHGIVSRVGETDHAIAEHFPIGSRIRILPNHACATGAQYPEYHAVAEDGSTTVWPRFYGW